MTKSEALQKLIAWLLSQVGYKAHPDLARVLQSVSVRQLDAAWNRCKFNRAVSLFYGEIALS